MRCNLACANCNRLCHIYRSRTEDMTVHQIKKFVNQLREHKSKTGRSANAVKIVGGEPFLHPQFDRIYAVLLDALKEGLIKKLKPNSNGTILRPSVEDHPQVRWLGKSQRRKRHLPYLWSPADLGHDTTGKGCEMLRRCGPSLDRYGWLTCSAAIMIARLFDLTHLYRHELPDDYWGLDELCQHCCFAMPTDWQKEHARSPLDATPEEQQPTPSWRDAMTRWNERNQSVGLPIY